MNIYSDKLAHIQVVINCRYSIAQMCTWEDAHAGLGDVMSQNKMATIFNKIAVNHNHFIHIFSLFINWSRLSKFVF